MTDEELLERVVIGDTHTFSILVDRYKDKVFGMIGRLTGNFTEAQDLSQEVFLNAFKSLKKFDGRSKFSTWLYRISYNISLDWIRRNNKKTRFMNFENIEHNSADESSEPESSFFKKQKLLYLNAAINTIGEKYRTVLILFHYQGFSYEEIGDILDLPVKTVETRLYRGRNLLKKELCGSAYGGEFNEMQADG